MRQILFLAAMLLLLGSATRAQASETISTTAVINTCSSCGKCNDSKCGCEKPKCGCEKPKCGCEKPKCGCEKPKCGCEKPKCGCEKPKCGCEKPKCGCEKPKCGCSKPKCGCEQKCSCEKKCGWEEKDCGCISNEIMYGDGLAFSLAGAESMASSGLAFTMTDNVSPPLDASCCPSEKFCLLDNCTECYSLVCCPTGMELLCNERCGKQKCGSCNKCEHKCGCEKPKCGCGKQKCGCKEKASCGCKKQSCGCGKCGSH
ncbi:MAG: hypothetical protein R3F46_07995 [bacterium]